MKDGATMVTMKSSFKGHVRNGQIVLDEPADLPDGTPVEVSPTVKDDFGEMTPEERAELDAACTESEAEFERGEYVDAREFIRQRLARS